MKPQTTTEEEVKKCKERISELEQRLYQNTKDYFKELDYHRQAAYRAQKQLLEQTKVQDEYLLVKFFEEEDLIQQDPKTLEELGMEPRDQFGFRQVSLEPDPFLEVQCDKVDNQVTSSHRIPPGAIVLTQTQQKSLIERLNSKLEQLKTNYELLLNKNQRYLNKLTDQIHLYRSLPRDLSGISHLTVSDLLGYVAQLEKDPHVIYELTEEQYYSNFFEKVVFAKFGHLFDLNAEEKTLRSFAEMKEDVLKQVALIQAYAAKEIYHFHTENNDLRRELKDVTWEFDRKLRESTIEAEKQAKFYYIDKVDAFKSQFQLRLELMEHEKEEALKQLANSDQLILKVKMKSFLFRWHVQVQLKRIIDRVGEVSKLKSVRDYENLLMDQGFAGTVLDVQEKVRKDVDAQIMSALHPLKEKLQNEKIATEALKEEIVDLKYRLINKEKRVSHVEGQFHSLQEDLAHKLTDLKNLEEKHLKQDIRTQVDKEENYNLKKALDLLNSKNQRLKDKLNAIGISKMPISEIERRLHFTQNDKEIESCSIINEVHHYTMKLFNVPETDLSPRSYFSSLKKGSLMYFVESLRQLLIEQITPKLEQQFRIRISEFALGVGSKSMTEQGTQTKMKDVNCELIHRSSQGIIGNPLTHSGAQTSHERKTFADKETSTDMLDLDQTLEDLAKFKRMFLKEEKARRAAEEQVAELDAKVVHLESEVKQLHKRVASNQNMIDIYDNLNKINKSKIDKMHKEKAQAEAEASKKQQRFIDITSSPSSSPKASSSRSKSMSIRNKNLSVEITNPSEAKNRSRRKSKLDTGASITILKSTKVANGASDQSDSKGPRTSITIRHQREHSNPKGSFDSQEDDQVRLISKRRPSKQFSKRKLNLMQKGKISSEHKRSGASRSPLDASPAVHKMSKQISIEDTEEPVQEMEATPEEEKEEETMRSDTSVPFALKKSERGKIYWALDLTVKGKPLQNSKRSTSKLARKKQGSPPLLMKIRMNTEKSDMAVMSQRVPNPKEITSQLDEYTNAPQNQGAIRLKKQKRLSLQESRRQIQSQLKLRKNDQYLLGDRCVTDVKRSTSRIKVQSAVRPSKRTTWEMNSSYLNSKRAKVLPEDSRDAMTMITTTNAEKSKGGAYENTTRDDPSNEMLSQISDDPIVALRTSKTMGSYSKPMMAANFGNRMKSPLEEMPKSAIKLALDAKPPPGIGTTNIPSSTSMFNLHNPGETSTAQITSGRGGQEQILIQSTNTLDRRVNLGTQTEEDHTEPQLDSRSQDRKRAGAKSEKEKWLLKLSANNTLDNKLMDQSISTFYKDVHTGQNYVHINDLKRALSRKLTTKLQPSRPSTSHHPLNPFARHQLIGNTDVYESTFDQLQQQPVPEHPPQFQVHFASHTTLRQAQVGRNQKLDKSGQRYATQGSLVQAHSEAELPTAAKW